jgi:nitroreductase
MDILQLIRERRSVRQFADRDIPDGIVDRLIEAFVRPTTEHLNLRRVGSESQAQLQPYRFIKGRCQPLLLPGSFPQ